MSTEAETAGAVPLVSVLMITYNHEAHIARAIEGVLSQKTAFPFELIIGEDCSKDRTGEIVREYAARHPGIIRLVTSPENVGMKRNASRVLEAARGKYVAWCEGDDWWIDEHKLADQAAILEADDGVGMVYTDHDRVDLQTGERQASYLRVKGYARNASPGIEDILAGTAGIQTCTVMARTDMVRSLKQQDAYLYSSNEILMTDVPMWAEIAMRSRVAFIDRSTAARGVLAESATQSRQAAKRLRFWISSSVMRMYLCDKYHLPAQLRKLHETLWRRRSLKLALLEGDRALAAKVRQASPGFDLRDWLLYIGARVPLLGAAMRGLIRIN